MSIFQAPPSAVSTLPAYNDAVNASRFVKGFGIAVLAYSFLLFLGLNLLASGIGIGTGLFIFRYDEQKFYRIVGVSVIVLAFVSPIPFLSPTVVAASVLFKGSEILSILGESPKDDPDWSDTRSRTMLGMFAGGGSLLVISAYIVLWVISFFVLV
jgi:hypothetical protein